MIIHFSPILGKFYTHENQHDNGKSIFLLAIAGEERETKERVTSIFHGNKDKLTVGCSWYAPYDCGMRGLIGELFGTFRNGCSLIISQLQLQFGDMQKIQLSKRQSTACKVISKWICLIYIEPTDLCFWRGYPSTLWVIWVLHRYIMTNICCVYRYVYIYNIYIHFIFIHAVWHCIPCNYVHVYPADSINQKLRAWTANLFLPPSWGSCSTVNTRLGVWQ